MWLLGFALLVIVLLLGTQLTSALDVQQTQLAFRTTVHELIKAELDAETAQRGFLLTGDQSYLQPFETSEQQIPTLLATFKLQLEKIGMVPGDDADLNTIDDLSRSKLDEIKQTIDLAQNGNAVAALDMVKSGKGKNFMDQIRQATDNILGRKFQQSIDIQNTFRRLLPWCGLALLLLFPVLGFQFASDLKRRETERKRLSFRSEELEKLVEQRTGDLKREAQRVEALLSDATHRVGNNISIVASLVSLQARESKDESVKRALEDVRGRIQAIGASQRRFQLASHDGFVDYRPQIGMMLDELRELATLHGIEIIQDLAPLEIPARDSLSISVIVNEFVTNAIRHAFGGRMGGKIVVTLKALNSTTDQGSNTGVFLSVQDDGRGNIKESGGESGIGSKIIELMMQSLNAQWAGSTDLVAPLTGHNAYLEIQIPWRPQS